MITLLPIERRVGVAEPPEALERKLVIRALGLLQTKYVRPMGTQELCHQVDAQRTELMFQVVTLMSMRMGRGARAAAVVEALNR